MIAINRETGKEVKEGNKLKMSLFPRTKNDFSKREVKEVIFLKVSPCKRKIMVKEFSFDNEWVTSFYPSLFNLDIRTEV